LHQIICYIAKHEQRNHSGVKLLKLGFTVYEKLYNFA